MQLTAIKKLILNKTEVGQLFVGDSGDYRRWHLMATTKTVPNAKIYARYFRLLTTGGSVFRSDTMKSGRCSLWRVQKVSEAHSAAQLMRHGLSSLKNGRNETAFFCFIAPLFVIKERWSRVVFIVDNKRKRSNKGWWRIYFWESGISETLSFFKVKVHFR